MKIIPDTIAPVSAKTAAILNLLQTEMCIAISAYEGRRYDADHMALKRAKVIARLRFRSFFLSAVHYGG